MSILALQNSQDCRNLGTADYADFTDQKPKRARVNPMDESGKPLAAPLEPAGLDLS
jgi:hypothetical protein